MEIIYKTNAKKSNFSYCADMYKGKKKINGFNKMCEPVCIDSFEVRDVNFREAVNGTLYICYPLSVVVKETITFSSLHSLISEIRRVYNEIYNDPIQFGIWGHCIEGLVIEAITIYKDNSIDVAIGS